jgi:hypothetical protein
LSQIEEHPSNVSIAKPVVGLGLGVRIVGVGVGIVKSNPHFVPNTQ